MKKINYLIVILLTLMLSGCTSTYYVDGEDYYELEDETSELKDEVDELQRCQEEFQYAVEEAKNNLENGYYEDAYYDLDGIQESCLR